jgi:hypothetical protein
VLSRIKEGLKVPEHRTALMLAMGADALQIAAFPLFAEGGVSPLDTLLDFLVGFALIRMLGWHWAFLPSFIAEIVPGMDLFPTWTAAVLYVTHERANSGEGVVLPPGPAPAARS